MVAFELFVTYHVTNCSLPRMAKDSRGQHRVLELRSSVLKEHKYHSEREVYRMRTINAYQQSHYESNRGSRHQEDGKVGITFGKSFCNRLE